MAQPRVFTDIVTVGAATDLDIQPATGRIWVLTDVGSSVFVGVPPLAVPEINVSLFDGALQSEIMLNNNIRGFSRKQNIYFNRATYLRLRNPNGGAPRNLSFSILEVADHGVGASTAVSDVQAIAAGLFMDIRPPVGQEWMITDIGSSQWLGAAPAQLPDVTVQITDGVSFATIMNATNFPGWFKPHHLYISNTHWIRVTNTNALLANLSFSGVMTRDRNGAAQVISDVATVGIGGVLIVRPPVGEEWYITQIGASVWVGGAPAQYPDVDVQLTDGVIASLLSNNANDKGWIDPIGIHLDRNNWLTITNTNAGGLDVGFTGAMTQQY